MSLILVSTAQAPNNVAIAATGSFTFAALPANNKTLTIENTVYTFVTGTPANANQIQIGADLSALLTALIAKITTGAAASTYVTAVRGSVDEYPLNNVILLKARVGGTVGNQIDISSNDTNITASGVKLAGGVDIVTQEDCWTPIGYGLEVLIPPDAINGDSWTLDVTPFTTPERVAFANINNTIAITSNYELISLITSNIVVSYNNTAHTFNYPDKRPKCHINHRSEHLTFFYNHLFLAHNRTLWWTDLDNLWNWYPTPSSEADFRDIEWETHPITALTKFNDVLFVHFPNCIYTCEYVGKPTIVKITNRICGAGAVGSRCACATKSALFFLGADNFYLWSPDKGLQAIGAEVWGKVTQQITDVSSIWCYVDQRNSEVCWVSGEVIWAFNYLENHWQKYDSNGAVCHASVPWYPEPPGADESDTALINKVYPIGLENLWITPSGLVREQRWDDTLADCLTYTNPYLETDEISYGDNHFHKKVDLIFIDCDYDYPWHGVDVSVSVNNYVSERTRWVKVGHLDKFQHGSLQQVDFPARSGRVIKYRFELISNMTLVLNDAGHDLFNGAHTFNNPNQRFLGRQFRYFDGSLLFDGPEQKLNRFDFYSWGQRVDLPQTLIGPDK